MKQPRKDSVIKQAHNMPTPINNEDTLTTINGVYSNIVINPYASLYNYTSGPIAPWRGADEYNEYPAKPPIFREAIKERRYKLRPFPREVLIDILINTGSMGEYHAKSIVDKKDLVITDHKPEFYDQTSVASSKSTNYMDFDHRYWIPIEVCEEIKDNQ